VRREVFRIPAAVGVAVLLAACNGSSTPTPTTPSTVSVTENYSGDLVQNGQKIHTFSTGAGVVTATLTSLTPLATASVGMSLGLWDGTNCGVTISNENTKVGSTVVGTSTQATVSLCLRVYDVGNFAAGTTYSYTATVVHY
jgi:hypothetical protein